MERFWQQGIPESIWNISWRWRIIRSQDQWAILVIVNILSFLRYDILDSVWPLRRQYQIGELRHRVTGNPEFLSWISWIFQNPRFHLLFKAWWLLVLMEKQIIRLQQEIRNMLLYSLVSIGMQPENLWVSLW